MLEHLNQIDDFAEFLSAVLKLVGFSQIRPHFFETFESLKQYRQNSIILMNKKKKPVSTVKDNDKRGDGTVAGILTRSTCNNPQLFTPLPFRQMLLCLLEKAPVKREIKLKLNGIVESMVFEVEYIDRFVKHTDVLATVISFMPVKDALRMQLVNSRFYLKLIPVGMVP